MAFGYSQLIMAGAIPAVAYPLSLLNGLNSNGTSLAATTAAGNYAITRTAGSVLTLVSENANNNTKTDTAIWAFTLPLDYQPGSNLIVNVNALYTPGSGTVGTHTVVAVAYLQAGAGAEGANLVTTAAQSTTASAAAYSFTVTGTNLLRNSLLTIGVTAVTQETAAGGNITTTINGVTLT